MGTLPLRTYLRNHSDVYRCSSLKPNIRGLFDEKDMLVRSAEFFVADPKHGKNQFLVTCLVSGRLLSKQADIITVQDGVLAILIRYAGRRTRQLETEGLSLDSIASASLLVKRKGVG